MTKVTNWYFGDVCRGQLLSTNEGFGMFGRRPAGSMNA